jgi:hypothetical protein
MKIMKKLILSFVTVVALATAAFALPNEKVLRSFNATFSSPKGVEWFETGKTFEARFVQNDIRTIAQYDADGKFLGSLRYYTEKNLPFYISSAIKSKYPDRKIYGVSEQVKDDVLTYFVKLESATHWYTLQVSAEGNMEITEKFKKA